MRYSAKVSNDTKTQDLEFCVSLSEEKEMCQSLEEIVKAQGENQTSGESSNETSASGNSTKIMTRMFSNSHSEKTKRVYL